MPPAPVPVLIPAAYVIAGNTAAFDYEQLAIEANGTLASMLHLSAVEFLLNVDDDPPHGSEYAQTTSWFGALDLLGTHHCEISIHNQKFVGVTPLDAQSIVTHEMFHCYQQRAAKYLDSWKKVSPSISEGEATW